MVIIIKFLIMPKMKSLTLWVLSRKCKKIVGSPLYSLYLYTEAIFFCCNYIYHLSTLTDNLTSKASMSTTGEHVHTRRDERTNDEAKLEDGGGGGGGGGGGLYTLSCITSQQTSGSPSTHFHGGRLTLDRHC